MNIGNETWFLPLLILFLLGLGFALYTLKRDQRDLNLLGYHNFILNPAFVFGRRITKGLFILTAFFLVFLGAVRLQGKPTPEDIQMRGIDVMIVLDLSKSMLTQDMVPNRLEAAKKALLNWIQNRDGDRVGLVVFAGEALVQVPLTFDLEAVSLLLDRDDPDAVDRGGTDIGEGIRTALAAFPKDDSNKRGKAILLITDGEITDRTSNVTQACMEAKNANVPVVAVGIGTPQGRPIPDGASFWGEAIYKKDSGGNVHVSRLDEQTLAKIADMTGGVFVRADNAEGLGSIEKSLDGLQKTAMKGQGVTRRQELAPAMGLWATAALLFSSLI